MKKVLIYENRKTDPICWDASTPELENQAFLALFHLLDEEWDVYLDLKEDKQPALIGQNQVALYHKAKQGDVLSCRRLLSQRLRYEYEFWQLIPVREY